MTTKYITKQEIAAQKLTKVKSAGVRDSAGESLISVSGQTDERQLYTTLVNSRRVSLLLSHQHRLNLTQGQLQPRNKNIVFFIGY